MVVSGTAFLAASSASARRSSLSVSLTATSAASARLSLLIVSSTAIDFFGRCFFGFRFRRFICVHLWNISDGCLLGVHLSSQSASDAVAPPSFWLIVVGLMSNFHFASGPVSLNVTLFFLASEVVPEVDGVGSVVP